MITLTEDGVVRAWPDDGAEAVGSVPRRSMLPVSGRTVDFTWWQVPYPDGPGGYGWLTATVTLPNSGAAAVPVIQVILPTPLATPAATPAPIPVPVQPTPVPAPQSCSLNATFVKDVTIPDGMVVQPRGQAINQGVAAAQQRHLHLGQHERPEVRVRVPDGRAADREAAADRARSPGRRERHGLCARSGRVCTGPSGSRVPARGDAVRAACHPDRPGTQPGAAAPADAPPQPEPQPSTIHFWADHTSLAWGKCTKLQWDVENAKRVDFYDGKKWKGVGGHDNRKTCPEKRPTTYKLRVTDLVGNPHERQVLINVSFKPVPNPNPGGPAGAEPEPYTIRRGRCRNPNPYDPPGPVPNLNPYDPPGPLPWLDPDDPFDPAPNPNADGALSPTIDATMRQMDE